MKKNLKISITIIVILSLYLAQIPSTESQAPFPFPKKDEYLHIMLYGNGRIGLYLMTALKKPLLMNIDVLNLNLLKYVKRIGLSFKPSHGRYGLGMILRGAYVNENEADAVGYEIAKTITYKYFGVDCSQWFKQVVRWPKTGKLECIILRYKFNITADEFFNFFKNVLYPNLKCPDGFIKAVNDEMLKKCEVEIEEEAEAEGPRDIPLYYMSILMNCSKRFNLKIGETYILNLFEILNITGTFSASRNSAGSEIKITISSHVPWINKIMPFFFQVVDAYFSGLEWVIGRGYYGNENIPLEIEISNRQYNIAGKVFDGIWVKFKVVERGFKPEISISYMGFAIIIFSVLITIIIYLYFFRKRKV